MARSPTHASQLPVLKRQAGACAMFGVLISVIVGALYLQHRQREWVLRREQAQHRLDVAFELISREVNRVRSDALYLANRHVLRQFVSGEHNRRDTLTADCMLFVQQKELYDQVRLLDLEGREVIRVNFSGQTAVSVDSEALQDKSDRYYYREARELQRGEIFVSDFDLNVEHGEIEQPLKPVIRFVTPVADNSDQIRGYLVLNYLGAELLKELAEPTAPGHTLLLRRDGHYIRTHIAQDAWGWLLGHGRSFASQFPTEWRSLGEQTSDCRLTENGVFAFRTIPLGRVPDSSDPVGSGQRHDKPLDEDFLVVVSYLPSHAVFAASNQLLKRLIIFSAGIFGLAVVFTRAWARATWARHEQARRIATSEERLRELSSRLLRIQEDERRAISREIHDELGQQATAINLDLKLAQRNIETDKVASHLQRAIEENETLLRTLQDFARRVRPAVLDDLGLADAIESHVSEFQRRTSAAVQSYVKLPPTGVADEIADNTFRLVQESLNNVAKHADATHVTVSVTASAPDYDHLLITVKDDGRGSTGVGDGGGLGWIGMQERVDLLDGELRIQSDEDQGTEIQIRLPLSRNVPGEVTCP